MSRLKKRKSRFQIDACRTLGEFAKNNQLEGYVLSESRNGVEYKNYLNDTVFTVYHDRLDNFNEGKIEIAVGCENLSTELSIPLRAVQEWLSNTEQILRTAESKSPQLWPRVAVHSHEEVQNFCRSFDNLMKMKNEAASSNASGAETERNARQNPEPVDERIFQEILTRRGQPEFRSALLQAYDGRCAITGCADTHVLEAAHIIPHSKMENYQCSNGILMRADIHTLFDLQLISINPSTAEIVVAKGLSDTYQRLNGRFSKLPVDPELLPDATSLMWHFQQMKRRDISR